MKTVLVALLCVTFCTKIFAFGENFFKPLNLTGNYIGRGVACVTELGEGISCANVTLVIDSTRQAFFFGTEIIGNFWYLNNGSYYLFETRDQPAIKCGLSNMTFAQQIAGFAGAFSYTSDKRHYAGLVTEGTACNLKASATFTLHGGFLTQWINNERFPLRVQIPPSNQTVSICVSGQTVVDIYHIDTWSDRSRYFVLPPECTNPSSTFDYCKLRFPPGNVCEE